MENAIQNVMDQEFIRLTYQLARESVSKGFEPFAALLVNDGQIMNESFERSIEYLDPTGHAELITIRRILPRESDDQSRRLHPIFEC